MHFTGFLNFKILKAHQCQSQFGICSPIACFICSCGLCIGESALQEDELLYFPTVYLPVVQLNLVDYNTCLRIRNHFKKLFCLNVSCKTGLKETVRRNGS